jgi:hypothetical protein
MATATVFVDDAVLGRLPPVCVKTGQTTGDRLVLTAPVGSTGLGAAWLLLFLGPFGWLALFIYALVHRSETLTVRLPFSDRAHDELAQARRRQRALGWSTVATLLGAFTALVAMQPFSGRAAAAALAVVGVGLLVSWIAEALHVRRAGVGVDLDGSRRWVTLSRVHDDFARAVYAFQNEQSETRRSPLSQPS